MFSRVAIVNRGEAAMRLIHAVRELAAETGTRIETVALYTDVDHAATFVREADLSYDLGPAAARPTSTTPSWSGRCWRPGGRRVVGWGFVAEDPAFAELCDRVGVTSSGRAGGDAPPGGQDLREAHRRRGGCAGRAVEPRRVETLPAALAAAGRDRLPADAEGDRGRGGAASAWSPAKPSWRTPMSAPAERPRGRSVAASSFLERLVTGARHVEVQVIADGEGTAWALGVRDCSIQRRNQKIIESRRRRCSTSNRAAELKASAERLALAVGYRGAATVEFLYHPGTGSSRSWRSTPASRSNTRSPSAPPGFDWSRPSCGWRRASARRRTARGTRARRRGPAERGGPRPRLRARPGRIVRLDLPAGPGIRVDTGVGEGDTIPADFDSMIAKIIAYGHDREEAFGRLRRAMSQTRVVIEGGATNKSFVLDLLDQPEVIDGADTGWIDRVRGEGGLVSHRHSAVALAAAAIDAYEEEEHAERQRLLSTASGGRPQVQHESGRPLDLKLRGVGYRVRVARVGPHRFRVGIQAGDLTRTADVELDRFDRHIGQIVVNGTAYHLLTATHGPIHLVEVDGVTHRVGRDEGGVVRSPAPALVVATPLEVGAEVEAGAPVLVLESMKMETVLRAPFRARLRECTVSVGSQVDTVRR